MSTLFQNTATKELFKIYLMLRKRFQKRRLKLFYFNAQLDYNYSKRMIQLTEISNLKIYLSKAKITNQVTLDLLQKKLSSLQPNWALFLTWHLKFLIVTNMMLKLIFGLWESSIIKCYLMNAILLVSLVTKLNKTFLISLTFQIRIRMYLI